MKKKKTKTENSGSMNYVIVEEKRYGPDGSAGRLHVPLACFNLIYKVSVINQYSIKVVLTKNIFFNII